MTDEDAAFRAYLEENGYDTFVFSCSIHPHYVHSTRKSRSRMGLRPDQMKDELETQAELGAIDEKTGMDDKTPENSFREVKTQERN